MKIKSLLFCTVASVVCCLGNANANQCPAGCFCLNGGQTESGTPQPDYRTCEKIHPEQNPSTGMYKSSYGTYGFEDGEFVYESGSQDYTDNNGVYHSEKYDKVFNCPKSHPESAGGSKALTDCYKYDEAGNKVYYGSTNYGNCNIDGIRATVQNLSQALSKAAQDLQDALDKPEQNTNNAAGSSSKVSEKTNWDKTKTPGKLLPTGKSMRSGSRSLNDSLDAAKAAISAGI